MKDVFTPGTAIWARTQKIPVHPSLSRNTGFPFFPPVNMKENRCSALFLFVWSHSCFKNEIRLQQVAFPAAAPSKINMFLNHKLCNNTDGCSCYHPISSVCSIHQLFMGVFCQTTAEAEKCDECSLFACLSAQEQPSWNLSTVVGRRETHPHLGVDHDDVL